MLARGLRLSVFSTTDRVFARRNQMRRHMLAPTIAGVFALAVGIAAQEPPATPSAQPQKAPTVQSQAAATVEGCLMREQDVPGRKPNVAERAGVLDDYILTNAKVVKGSAPAAAQARPGEPTGTAGTVSAPMFDVKGIDDKQLKEFAGKRVQIDGTFADVDKSPTAGPTKDLVDIRGTAIRAASGECPPK
jgi:hypothetical protein